MTKDRPTTLPIVGNRRKQSLPATSSFFEKKLHYEEKKVDNDRKKITEE